ncbi:MAG: FliI/YscN family ATPase [Pseudomonadota bacterium]
MGLSVLAPMAAAELAAVRALRIAGRISALRDGAVEVLGFGPHGRIGDGVRFERSGGAPLRGEIVGLSAGRATAMAYGALDGAALYDRVWLEPAEDPAPSDAWLGQVLDAFGRPVDGGVRPQPGAPRTLRAAPPPAMARRPMGARLPSGLAAFDTMLPLCRGQRVGVFAGSGVGKSRLMAALAQRMSTDVVVIGLIGERGREVRAFVEQTLGAEALKRSVVIAATSDQPAPVKRRAAWLTLSTAEHFRDQGAQVLLLFDSLTRFAEAHREVALTGGEAASLNGHPPSMTPMIAGLAERAGPGPDRPGTGDVTAVFTVLVAGGDMDEPVADTARGILDGHIVLSREIAERGRFPALDVRRSVSRSLPDAASPAENALIADARRVLATYEQAEPMIQIGLYKAGSDAEIDRAIAIWPALDAFFAEPSANPDEAFARLAAILRGRG